MEREGTGTLLIDGVNNEQDFIAMNTLCILIKENDTLSKNLTALSMVRLIENSNLIIIEGVK